MWPKAFAQLVELAPHISRLLPMADRFFQNKTASEDANRRSIDALGDRLHADLDKVNIAHASLSEQISEVSTKLNRIASESEMFQASAASLDHRLTMIERSQTRLAYLCMFALLALLAVLVLAIMIYVRGR